MRFLRSCPVLLFAAACGCTDRAPTQTHKSEPPAKVDSPVKETDLTKLHLTESAERRLGITLAPVEKKSITSSRVFGGTVTIPQGGSIGVTAPLAGTLLIADAGLTRPGATVKKQQKLLRLSPVFGGQQEVLPASERVSLAKAEADLAASRVEAAGQAAVAEAQLEASKAQLERAARLRQEQAGSQQAYEEALAATRKAEADLHAARSRLQVLSGIRLRSQPESAPALDILSPFDGMVTALHVRPGLQVPVGTPLLDVAVTDPIWVRVAAYVGELESVDASKGAQVRRLGPATDGSEEMARAVPAAPTGNANAATLDLFFELPNPDLKWKPEEKVIVRIPLRQPADALSVPLSAVVHDIHGGSWVYVQAAPQTYVRQRVEVREIVHGRAILFRGPEAGVPVVAAGAAELFGTEFGAGK